MQKYKGLQETIMNNYMTIKWITWKKWTDSLKKFNLPRLNQREIEIMNNTAASTEIEAAIKNLPKNESQDQTASQENSIKYLERANAYPSKALSKKLQRKEHFQSHSTRPPSPWYQNQTKTTQEKKTTGQYHWWT